MAMTQGSGFPGFMKTAASAPNARISVKCKNQWSFFMVMTSGKRAFSFDLEESEKFKAYAQAVSASGENDQDVTSMIFECFSQLETEIVAHTVFDPTTWYSKDAFRNVMMDSTGNRLQFTPSCIMYGSHAEVTFDIDVKPVDPTVSAENKSMADLFYEFPTAEYDSSELQKDPFVVSTVGYLLKAYTLAELWDGRHRRIFKKFFGKSFTVASGKSLAEAFYWKTESVPKKSFVHHGPAFGRGALQTVICNGTAVVTGSTPPVAPAVPRIADVSREHDLTEQLAAAKNTAEANAAIAAAAQASLTERLQTMERELKDVQAAHVSARASSRPLPPAFTTSTPAVTRAGSKRSVGDSSSSSVTATQDALQRAAKRTAPSLFD
jgi:hypothetical protein